LFLTTMTEIVAMRAPRHAKTVINRLLNSRSITEEGLNWLTLATDPFHDAALAPCGLPDMSTTNSVVQCFTYTQNITQPPIVAPTAQWDAQVVFCPFSYIWPGGSAQTALYPLRYDAALGVITAPVAIPATQPIYGGYNVLTGVNGFDWQALPPVTSWQSSGNTLSYPNQASSGQYRLIGCGYEVVNTTPDLYKGGAVTVYRTPNNTGSKFANAQPSGSGNFFVTATPALLPPSTQNEAQLYPTSKTWAAELGSYGIGVQSDVVNPFLSPVPTSPLWLYAPSSNDLNAGTVYTAFGFPQTWNTDGTNGSFTLSQAFPFENHGCIFTGLNPNTTLQVTVKYYVERVPTTSEPDLLVLSRPPTPYDPLALELYNRVSSELPVAVQVGENPLGEWFNEVLDIAVNCAPVLGSMMGPGGAVAMTAASKAISSYRSMNRPENARPQPTVMRNPPQNNRPNRPRRKPPGRSNQNNQQKKKKRNKKKKLTPAQKAQVQRDLGAMLGLV